MRVLCHRLHVRHRGHFLMARAHHAARRKGAGRTGEKERLMEVHEEAHGGARGTHPVVRSAGRFGHITRHAGGALGRRRGFWRSTRSSWACTRHSLCCTQYRKGAGRTGEKERLMEVHEELVGSVSTPQATPGSFVRPYSSATSCGSAGGSVVTGPPNDWSSTPESAHTLAASPL